MVEPLIFPKTLFKEPFGFSIDFGSSVNKIIYTSEDGDNIRMNFVSFSDLDEAIEFLVTTCKDKLAPGSQVYTCGIGATLHVQRLQDALKLRFVSGEDALFEAILFMVKHLPWEHMFHPVSPTALEHGAILAKQFATMYGGISTGKIQPWPYMKDVDVHEQAVRSFSLPSKVQYPVLLSQLGSAFGVGKLHEDGRFEGFSLVNTPAGKTFLGLGSLLLGTKDFDELADLASHGDSSQVDHLMSALQVNQDDKYYKNLAQSNNKVFAFGQAIGKGIDDFKREDIAAALLSLIISTAVNETFVWAESKKLSHVIFYGGFVTSTDHIREEIEKEFAIRRFANPSSHMCQCSFLKHAAHILAIGTLLKNLVPHQ